MIHVVTAAQAAVRDAAAMASGIPSFDLMERAGIGAAGVIAGRYADRLSNGVAIFTGPGNNGGDGWVVARVLAGTGAVITVCEAGEARSDDARRARELALPHVSLGSPSGREELVIDALLGTGGRGAPSGAIAAAIDRVRALHESRTVVASLDMPSGIDATTGLGALAVAADLTVTFGTVKRGQLIARGACGALVVVDIGLGESAALDDGAPLLVDEAWVRARVPRIGAEAHKGIRRRIAIVGGARGMAGASVLAARAAMRSGIGMVRLVVSEASLAPVQSAVPEATAATWPLPDEELDRLVGSYAHAVLVGPGLGAGAESRAFVERLLARWQGPVVVDADALNVFAGDIPALAALLDGRPAVITPHPAELARLTGSTADAVLTARFEVGREVARALRAVVLLKGLPTVVSAPNGDLLVSAAGTPVLAAAGSGDVLGGVVATLLAQTGEAFVSAAGAAWVHGRAAELANAGRPVRGITLDDVLARLPDVWAFPGPAPEAPVLGELPRVGDAP